MRPDEDGSMLEESDLLTQVHAFYVNYPHHTFRPLGLDFGLQLLYIQDVAARLVGPVHYGDGQGVHGCLCNQHSSSSALSSGACVSF